MTDTKPALTREPFTGFSDTSDEQRALATKHAATYAAAFAEAGIQAPTADHAILATHLVSFAEATMAANTLKSSKLTRSMFDDSTPRGQAVLLMFAGLVQRMYDAPYGSLNEAALDFAEVLVLALDVTADASKSKRRHPNG